MTMSNLRDRAKEKQSLLSSKHKKSYIAKIKDKNPFDYVKKSFQKIIINDNNINQISIIDPYFLPLDIDNVTSLFGGHAYLKIEIISKFDSASKEEDQKLDRKKKIIERSDFIRGNGLFKEFKFIHSKINMHDRYYILWCDDEIKNIYNIGGSIGQRFEDYIAIHEVTDPNLKSDVITYYNTLISNIKAW